MKKIIEKLSFALLLIVMLPCYAQQDAGPLKKHQLNIEDGSMIWFCG